MQDPTEVARGLDHIAALLAFAGEPKFKVKAYEHAAEVTRTLGRELGGLIEQGRLRELSGIGPALSRQMEELWNTGSSEYLERLVREHPEGAAELSQIEGMTPRRIRALSAALGIRSIDELQAACAGGRVRTVRGFGTKTEQRLLAACERHGQATGRAPARVSLARGLELAAFIRRELEAVVSETHLAGALRRGEELSDEIDIVVCGDVDRALRHLIGLRQVLRVDLEARTASLADGIPLRLHPAADNPGAALLVATGSNAHVEAVRELAAERAVSLACPFDSEQALYRSLGVSYVPPELRQGTGELEQARRCDFSGLIDSSDIQGVVHCHTTYSDGKNSVAEMARGADDLGMQFITITDHSPSAHYARGVTLDGLKQQWDEIAAVQATVPIRILRGIEADILADGSLDLPDAVLEQLDVVIASIHARHRMDRRAMTERLVRALSLPFFKIWGHGLGRIIGHREPIDCDVPAVLDALAAGGGAVEINADPHRLDLPSTWLPAARERRIPFVISVDAHSVRGFSTLRYGITQARRGGIDKAEVLNAAPAGAFAAAVKPTRHERRQ